MDFLKDVRKKAGSKRVTIFMDNLSVHGTNDNMNYMATHKMDAIFNASYYPDGNPIELVFSQVKNIYKRLKLNEFINGKATLT